ncbi:MAG TPA: aldehyde dehydrogenase family protein, partial [Oculatellaceae cyanobacterium]
MSLQISVRNPRSGKVDYWITPPTPEELAKQCTRLREAQIDWRQGGSEQRIEALQAWKQALLSQRDQLTKALVTDTGRWSVSILEIDSFISGIDRWCRLAPELLAKEDEKATAIPFIRLQQEYVPYSLVGVISPWNFPLLLSTIDTIPALLAGCAVVVKPSEIAPRFIQPLVETIKSVPKLRDVLVYVEGAGDTGSALIECVDLVCFTGSV